MDNGTSEHDDARGVSHLAPAAALLIRSTTAISGAVLMSLEILGFRIIGRTFGSALRETSVVIGVFLAAMSLGYYFGGRIVDRHPRVRTLVGVLLIAAAFIATVPWLDALVAQRVFDSSIPLRLHSSIVTILLFFLPTVALASVSPIAIRLLATEVGESGRTAGTISAISTVGSIIGSVGTAFVLIDLIESVDRTVWLLSVVMLVVAFLVAASQVGNALSTAGLRRIVIVAVSGGIALQLLLGAAAWMVRSSATGAVDRGATEVFRRDSSFHQILVIDHPPHRTLYFDRQKQTRIRIGNPLEGGLEYTDFFHFAPVVHPSMKKMLFIGVGGGTGPTRFAHDFPELDIDGVEVDPVVIEVAERYLGLKPGPKLRVHVDDGRAFLRRSGGGYDVIVVDAYSQNRYGSTIPAHLTTREFFEECRDKLAPGGIVVFNCAWGPSSAVTRAISKTLGEVFAGQLVFSRTNTVFIAGPESIEPMRLDLANRTRDAVASGAVKFPLDAGHVGSLAPAIKPGEVPLLTDDYAPVDTLIRRGER
ncbi:MAG: fused MFS/spermidine synthase [Thermoanaerobaculia bacterium]|nr:fused MFS/spermidine synthase [Thermoanaerobaculia bacterium]